MQRVRTFAMSLLIGRGASAATVQTILVRFLLLGINILTGIASARLLGPIGKGEQTTIAMWSQLIPMCVTLGLPASLMFGARQNPQREGSLFAAALMLSASVGLIAGAIGAALLPYWLGRLDGRVILYSQIFMVFVPYGMVSMIMLSVIEAHGKFAVENALILASALWTIIAITLLGLTGTANSVTVAIAYASAGLPSGIVGLFYATRLARPRIHHIIGAGRTLLDFGLRQYGSDLFAALSGGVDQLLIAGFLAPKAFGIYVVILSLCRVLNLVQQSIVVVLFPKIIGLPPHSIVETVERAARVSIAISIVPTVMIGLGGGELIRLIYGQDFVAGAAVIWFLLCDTLLGGLTRILAQALMAMGRPGAITLLNAVQFAISIPLCLALLPRYEIAGVAAGMLAATALRFVLTLLLYPLVLGIPRPRLIISGSDVTFIYSRLKALT